MTISKVAALAAGGIQSKLSHRKYKDGAIAIFLADSDIKSLTCR